MVDKTWVPERWDVGLWDEAHWDGQLGIGAETTPVVITSNDATLRITKLLTAETTPVVITPQDVTFTVTQHYVLFAETTAVVITPQDVDFRIVHPVNPFPQPGELHMGIPKYFVDRW